MNKKLFLNSGLCFVFGIVLLLAIKLLDITSDTEIKLFTSLVMLIDLLVFMLTYILVNKITAKTGDVIASTAFAVLFLVCSFIPAFQFYEEDALTYLLVLFVPDFLILIFLEIYSKMKVFVNKNRHYDKKPISYFWHPGKIYIGGFNYDKYKFIMQENMALDYSKVFKNLGFVCLFAELVISIVVIIFI